MILFRKTLFLPRLKRIEYDCRFDCMQMCFAPRFRFSKKGERMSKAAQEQIVQRRRNPEKEQNMFDRITFLQLKKIWVRKTLHEILKTKKDKIKFLNSKILEFYQFLQD